MGRQAGRHQLRQDKDDYDDVNSGRRLIDVTLMMYGRGDKGGTEVAWWPSEMRETMTGLL